MKTTTMTAIACLTAGVLAIWGCKPRTQAPIPPPEVRMLSAADADKLFDEAEKVEAVGEVAVDSEVVGDVTVTTTTQVFRIANRGGGTTMALGFCGGQCKVTGEGGLNGCQTSGCAPSGKSCTPLVCSGSCTIDRQCNRERTVGIFQPSAGIQ